jgi:hypothetical protein
MPEERDELEQAWQALTERERLVQQTVALCRIHISEPT